jgi:hypothetical protein
MTRQADRDSVALGFKVRTAWAQAVALGGPIGERRVLERRRVELADPSVPESRAPYHAALELSGREAEQVVRRASEAARKVGVKAVLALAEELRTRGHELAGIGLVVGSVVDPAKLGNPHVRAHASEGRLFRQVLEAGADACGVPCLVVVERELYGFAAEALGSSEDELRRELTELGRPVGRPWRVEDKAAALAARLVLEA